MKYNEVIVIEKHVSRSQKLKSKMCRFEKNCWYPSVEQL